MCGLTGSVNWRCDDVLQDMVALQTHRGPDDEGIWISTNNDGHRVGLGSSRLAIRDLSPAGHMPMLSDDGKVALVFNGEIYNETELRTQLEASGYRFKSHSDTELVLALYLCDGPACVKRLNGMFSIAIWDEQQQHLFLARDHFGIKPLYYVHDKGRFAFASEVKSFTALPDFSRRINYAALHQYLTFLWVPDPLTLFDGVLKLEAGHSAIYKNG